MKVIDLLNKIANGEEVPNEIRYREKNYIFYGINYVNPSEHTAFHRRIELNNLNDEVEVIEEDEFIDIEEINNAYYHESQDRINQTFKLTINDLIKNQKKIIRALKENK